MSKAESAVLHAILELARDLPPSTLKSLSALLESRQSFDARALHHFAANSATRERFSKLVRMLASLPSLDGPALSLAIRATAYAAAAISAEQRIDIAWTGPSTEAVPTRRVDQALYELVEAAETELLLVTYAAYRAERAMNALRAASERGVRVALVIELAAESGGKISFDGLDAMRASIPSARVYHWPLDRRSRTTTGAYGAMHVKCLVADRKRALVSSANLTGHALELNMELGLMVEGSVARRLALHFDQLVVEGELAPVPTEEGRE